jgi:hypothetical protein
VATDNPSIQAELSATRIVLSNVIARLVTSNGQGPEEIRTQLGRMKDDCKLAADRSLFGDVATTAQTIIEDLFNNITIAPR